MPLDLTGGMGGGSSRKGKSKGGATKKTSTKNTSRPNKKAQVKAQLEKTGPNVPAMQVRAAPVPYVPPPSLGSNPRRGDEAKYGEAPTILPLSPQSEAVYQYLSDRLAEVAAQTAQERAWVAYGQRMNIPPWQQPGFYNPEWGLMNNQALRGSDVNWDNWQQLYPDNEPPIWSRQGKDGRDHATSETDGGLYGGNPPVVVWPNAPTETGETEAGGDYGGYGYYGGGGYAAEPEEEPIVWTETYDLGGAPDWWQGLTPSRLTAETEFAAMLNALVPYLSPEDQQTMGAYLSRLFEGKGGYPFSAYNPAQVGYAEPPGSLAPGMTSQYLSAARAGNILAALQNMASSMGKKETDFGPGYKFLSQIAAALQSFGAKGDGEGMTRADYIQLLGALDPLLAETEGDALGAYGPAASMIFRPFFSAGSLAPVAKGQDGRYYFGQPNRGWF